MSGAIPIIRLRGVLLVAIQVELSDRLVKDLQNDLGREIQRDGVRAVVLELSGVDTFDTYIARKIRDMSQMAKLMGVQTIVAGLDPAIAITLVEMGMSFEGVPMTLDLEGALALLRSDAGEQAGHDGILLDWEARADEELFDPAELED